MKKYRISGKVNVGCLFLTILIIAGGYVGFKFGKVYLAKYLFNRRLYEFAGDVAKDYNAKRFPRDRAIAEEVLKEAENYSIDITLDDITINRKRDESITINVTWEGDIVLPQYTHYFIFEFEVKRKVVY